MSHLKQLLLGLGTVVNPFGSYPRYTYPARGDRARDLRAISGDMQAVNTALRKNTEKAIKGDHGKQAHHCAGAR
jgi:hypothetical protein